MTGYWMVMMVLYDTESERTRLRKKDMFVDMDMSLIILRPILVLQIISICQVRLYSQISVKSRQNLHVQLSQVHGNYATEYG